MIPARTIVNQPLDRKIIDPPALAAQVHAARQAGRTIVQCHGCFDLVHPGHVRYLRFARELGDVLIVSLTSDDAVGKAPDRPYIPQELRAENLAALEFVDWVVIDPHPTAAELLALLRPDVYVKGREYADARDPRFLREREIVERYGGRVVFHSGDVVFSSTRLIRSLERNEHLDEVRLRTLCSRGGINVGSLRAVLQSFAGLPVIVVGDLIREHYVWCDANAAAEDAPILALRQLDVTSTWGGAAGVTLQCRALGANPVLITAAAPDDGARAHADLLARGIRLHALPIRRDVLEQRTFVADDTKLFRVSTGGPQPLDSAWQRQAVGVVAAELREAALLLWCDYGYGMVNRSLVHAVAPLARKQSVTIVGGAPGPRGEITVIRDADLLCVTERRLRDSLHDVGQSLPSLTWTLLHTTGGRRALVTLHKRGVLGFDGCAGSAMEQRDGAGHGGSALQGSGGEPAARLRSEFVPSLALHYADLLGAEEAILSAAALTLATDGSLALATYLAAGAEALVVARPGRVTVSAEELFAWSDTRPELRAQSRFLPDAATPGDIAKLAPPLGAETAYACG